MSPPTLYTSSRIATGCFYVQWLVSGMGLCRNLVSLGRIMSLSPQQIPIIYVIFIIIYMYIVIIIYMYIFIIIYIYIFIIIYVYIYL